MATQDGNIAGTPEVAAPAGSTVPVQTVRLDYGTFKAMLMNPDVPDSEIARYLTTVPDASGPFDPRVVPDPQKVDMTSEADFDVESAIRWGNAICRWRRKERFLRRVADGDKRPVLCTEGDSWFQFPFLIDDVVDHLDDDFLVWSLDAAGDTSDNMVNRNPEYMPALVRLKQNGVSGFAFSAAGNDVIGEDLTGEPVLSNLLKQHAPGKDAAWHIDKAALAAVLSRLERDYRKVVATIRSDTDFKRLPIFVHGYDYAIPGGQPGDRRRPSYARQDEWLGGPMSRKGIVEPDLQRAIVRVLIDSLYDMLDRVAGKSSQTRVFVVDVRGTLQVGEWADEIHGTSEGFRQVASKFKAAISREI